MFLHSCNVAVTFQVEELYDSYCKQRRLRDGASKMVTAFNSATGSKEARESLNEANRGYREYTEVRGRGLWVHWGDVLENKAILSFIEPFNI